MKKINFFLVLVVVMVLVGCGYKLLKFEVEIVYKIKIVLFEFFVYLYCIIEMVLFIEKVKYKEMICEVKECFFIELYIK